MTLTMITRHLYMVLAAVSLAILTGIPLGILAYLFQSARKIILWTVEVLQTIPALALLGFIMVLFGPGRATVITGLLLYSLLPVVQNTYVGLSEVDQAIKEVAQGMGMTRAYRLLNVEIPVAWPLIFTGVRIAAVTSVGTAVFAAFVGGGGLGGVIYQGIRVSNITMILSGTFTLMIIAIAIDAVMAYIEKRFYRRFIPHKTA